MLFRRPWIKPSSDVEERVDVDAARDSSMTLRFCNTASDNESPPWCRNGLPWAESCTDKSCGRELRSSDVHDTAGVWMADRGEDASDLGVLI